MKLLNKVLYKSFAGTVADPNDNLTLEEKKLIFFDLFFNNDPDYMKHFDRRAKEQQ